MKCSSIWICVLTIIFFFSSLFLFNIIQLPKFYVFGGIHIPLEEEEEAASPEKSANATTGEEEDGADDEERPDLSDPQIYADLKVRLKNTL